MRVRAGLALAAVAVTVAVVAAVVIATRGGDDTPRTPTDDPGAFALSTVRLIVGNRYAEAWKTLHPVDRSVAPQREYVRCENRSRFTAKVVSARVRRISDDSVGLGNGHFVDSKAVEVVVKLSEVGVAPFEVRHTVHVVAADGKWKWILPSWRYGYFRDDACPGPSHAPAVPL
jgi:hypothetical protein